MSISKRKIKFYAINFTRKYNGQEISINPSTIINTFISNYNSASNKKIDINNNRFCLLDENFSYNHPYFSGYFISAKTQHRPPLIDESTLNRRENPKLLSEGEEERTHFVIKIDESTNDLILLLESRNVGITIKTISKYIYSFLLDQNIEYVYSIIARDNFLNELESLEKVKVCNLYLDKEILGSEALNFAEISEEMKEEVELTIKAKSRQSIKNKVLNIASSFIMGRETRIRKIKVIGIDTNNNPITLNTTSAQLDTHIRVSLDDETKIVNTNDILINMKEILRTF